MIVQPLYIFIFFLHIIYFDWLNWQVKNRKLRYQIYVFSTLYIDVYKKMKNIEHLSIQPSAIIVHSIHRTIPKGINGNSMDELSKSA